MTKLLHITSGQYVYFLSSLEYDRKNHKHLSLSTHVLDYEDSYMYEDGHIPIEEILEKRGSKGGCYLTSYKISDFKTFLKSEFAIIKND